MTKKADEKSKAPAMIYLQWEGPEFAESMYSGEPGNDATWCVDKINDTDVLYRRASKRVAEVYAELQKLLQADYEAMQAARMAMVHETSDGEQKRLLENHALALIKALLAYNDD